MKILQPKLVLGNEGKVLVDTTNLKNSSKSKKRKSDNEENLKPTKLLRDDGIYSDPPTSEVHSKNPVVSHVGVQTEFTDSDAVHEKVSRIKKMLTDEEPPSEYWKSLAEKRREALEIALEENKLLSDENEFLKGENKVLEEMLEEAKQLASLVQEITKSGDGDRDEALELAESFETEELYDRKRDPELRVD